MSISHSTSATGGTADESASVDSQFDTSDDVNETKTRLNEEAKEYRRLARLSLARVQGWASASNTSLDVPADLSDVPLPQFGGRQWVTSYEDELPFAVLTELLQVVEFKRKACERPASRRNTAPAESSQ